MKTKILTPDEVKKLPAASFKTEIALLKKAVKDANIDDLSGKANLFYTSGFRSIMTGTTGEEMAANIELGKRLQQYGNIISREFRARTKGA